jgi:2-polyprenyl-3-methyl-5-hydroxy-6-metoxy-1,4-benzoquinol methylase
MLKFLPVSSGAILDVGCGEGNFIASARKNRIIKEAWGIEPNKEAAIVAANKVDRVMVGTFDLVVQDLPRGHFDVVFFNDVLEHMVDPDRAISKCHEILSDQGYIAASIPNVRYVTNLFNLIIKKDWYYADSGILDRTHLRFFTKKSIERFIQDAGFELMHIEGINLNKNIFVRFLNILSFGFFEDALPAQFILTARPCKNYRPAKVVL